MSSYLCITTLARDLRSRQTGQNSIAPENSLPQIEQVRWGSALMHLAALRTKGLIQLGEGGLSTLRRPQHDRPACGVKARPAFRWRTMVAFHKEFRVSP